MNTYSIVAVVLAFVVALVWYFYLRASIQTTHGWQHRHTRQSNRILRQITAGQLRYHHSDIASIRHTGR